LSYACQPRRQSLEGDLGIQSANRHL
jgi:hypothetical protein